MNYRIVVQKKREDEEDDIFRGRRNDGGYNDVFTAEIGADEAVELGQHLWDISNRRKSNSNQA